MTRPLATLAGTWRITVVDSFQGTYAGNRDEFARALVGAALEERVNLVVADCLEWMADQGAAAFGAVLSNEFLSELNAEQVAELFKESRHILQEGGIALHSFLSPVGTTPAQRLLLEADSDPRWTRSPPQEWFSPSPEFVEIALRAAGFEQVEMARLKSNLTLTGEAARSLMVQWNVNEEFLTANERELEAGGLELPDWIVMRACTRDPGRP